MSVYQQEYNRITKEYAGLQERIKDYPRGSLRERSIRGKKYYYLQYRDGEHIRSQYIKGADVDRLRSEIEERKNLEREIKALRKRLNTYAQLIGIHTSYRPVKNVNYEEYTLFMSTVAHDHKSMDMDAFFEKYDLSKYRGVNKRYLAGFIDYINGTERQNVRKTNDLILDPYTYLMYFKYNDKAVLEEELKHAIPAFLCRGLLITNVQEAVNGSFRERGISLP